MRGTLYGCGFSTNALGDGVIDIKGVCNILKESSLAGSTLGIIGDEQILTRSVNYLRACGM
jgi:inosose dehydratase